MPGITPVEGADLLENCVTMLHRSRHISPTAMALTGLTSETTTLHWEDNFSIEKEDGTNSTARRFREKATQAKLSDNGNLPAYISIIEFSHPKALFNDKKTL